MATIADIQAETRLLTDSDTVSYPASDLLRRCNDAYEEIVGIIIGCDGLWQFDDSNFTNFPIGTTTLVAGQNDYSFDVAMLEIERVEVLDISGIWRLLNPIDKSQIDIAISEFMKTNGIPIYYDKQGASILLYPAPASADVTLASGLKVYFQRTAAIFTSAEVTTGTKVPGFASPHHYLISYKAALPYAQSYKPQRVPFLMTEIKRRTDLLIKDYSRRELDRRKFISTKGIIHR